MKVLKLIIKVFSDNIPSFISDTKIKLTQIWYKITELINLVGQTSFY